MHKKKSSAIALAALLLVGIVGGAYAYWNQTETIKNPFDTGTYGSTIIEDFKPSEASDWQPGIEVDKKVTVDNTGDQDLIIRAKLDETWTYKDETDPYKTVAAGAAVYVTKQISESDGLTEADDTVVTKTFSDSENWVDGGDGWYYYKVNLTDGQTSDPWLESVTLLANADMGAFETRYYVSTTEGTDPDTYDWIEYTAWHDAHDDSMPKYCNPTTKAFSDTKDAGFVEVLHNKTETTYVTDGQGDPLLGYSNSDYALTITTETVQATKDAVMAKFGMADETALTSFMTSKGMSWSLK